MCPDGAWVSYKRSFAAPLQKRRTFALHGRRFASDLSDELEQFFLRGSGGIVAQGDFLRANVAGVESLGVKSLERGAQISFLFGIKRVRQCDLQGDIFFGRKGYQGRSPY